MNFYQLALRYLTRKKSKTLLLFFVLVFIGSMVLSTIMIMRATEDSKSLIQEKTNAKVVVEIKNSKNRISNEEVEQISLLEGVSSINRQSISSVFLSNGIPFTMSESTETDNLKVTVFSYDDLENDSAFFEQRYRIIAGNYIDPDTQNGVVVNSLFAELNELNIGDTIEFKTEDGITASAEIVGLFFSGGERKQSDTTLAVNRMENNIFMDNNTFSQLFEKYGYYEVAVYAKNPEELEALKTNLTSIFSESPDKVSMTTSDTLFQQTKAPLEQIIRIVNLMLILTVITGTVVITILLCMWMRTRKKEAAIFISIGKTKLSILLQVLSEAFGVFSISVVGACGIGTVIAKILKNLFLNSQTANFTLEVALEFSDIISLLCIGSVIVIIAVIFSMFPILRANPKDTLSRMEG